MLRYATSPWRSGAVQGPHHREGGEIDALGPESGLADGLEQAIDHVPAGGHEHDPRARAVGGVHETERMVLQDRLLERHRDVVLGLEAHGRGELLGVR